VPLFAAAYDPAAHTVTPTPRDTVPKQTLQLTITASSLLDASEQPVAGNQGQPAGNFVATFGNAGVSLASAHRASGTISAQALDALLAREGNPTSALFDTVRMRRCGGWGARG
jgi:hypothetical protein